MKTPSICCLAFVSIWALTSCQHLKSPSANSTKPVAETQVNTGMLISYEIRGETTLIPKNGCRLRIENVKTRASAFVELRPSQNFATEALEPGRYAATRLSCATTRIWNLDGLFDPGVEVVPGRLSYAGRVVFDFSKTDLGGFRLAPRVESRQALAEFLAANRGVEVISGYTQKAIGLEVANADGPESFDVYARGTNTPETTLEPLMKKLKSCLQIASKEDSLRLGHLQYVATYQGRRFQDMKQQENLSALSDSFLTCIDNSLRTFQPAVANALEVRVSY